MGKNGAKRQWGSSPGGSGRWVLPRVVYEIEPGFVVGARLDGRARQVRRLAVRELAPHSVEPFAHRSNLANPDDLRAAVRGVAQSVGNGNGSCGLLIPDGAVRVVILDFETLPDNRKDAEALVRWRMRESLPSSPEEARLSLQILSRDSNHVSVLVVAVRTSVLAEYEQILEAGNGGPSLVLPATLAILPLLQGESGPGELLLHVCAGWLTAVVLENGRIRLWRCSDLQLESSGNLARGVAIEAARISESARDHSQISTDKIWLLERPLTDAGLAEEISRTLMREVVRLAPQGSAGRALSEHEQPVYENFGAAAAGLISNGN